MQNIQNGGGINYLYNTISVCSAVQEYNIGQVAAPRSLQSSIWQREELARVQGELRWHSV